MGAGMAHWITTQEAAKLTGYHPEHVRRLIKAGKVKGRKWARDWLVDRPSLQAYVRRVGALGRKRGPKRPA
jgi:excisionase family DNA binding protein